MLQQDDIDDIRYGFPTRGPPGCVMQPVDTFVNYVYSMKLYNNLVA
jgi:hypothetical protein